MVAIDRFPDRLDMAKARAGATETVNYEEVDVDEALAELTGGRGPDACIDAVGLEAHGHGPAYAYDRAKQMLKLEPDRPTALRQAIRACRNGGVVSVVGVYGGFVDAFPMGAIVNKGLTMIGAYSVDARGYAEAIKIIESGAFPLERLHTHTFGLEDVGRAIEILGGEVPGQDGVHLSIDPWM